MYSCVCSMCTPKRLGVWQKSAANSSTIIELAVYKSHVYHVYIAL